MTLTLLTALILGLILGPLARLLVPGRRDISLLLTVLIGASGGLVGAAVVVAVGDRPGFDILALLAGLAAAVVLVVLYGLVFGHDEPSSR
ncbi:MAG TPA: GlsB/YeaQ/YmgE family stress response membrane protein [Ornithinimicrobium sp.]|uniref:GlsB/YeaQ/YmgE family stress response membrane protein n=1 Tax=Ornithinimicrobium sp. TaxID=1977084 RepID=UPI002B48CEEA|nr:GlsB/YeaQ/YmgE family stress response membrane protein [Ornithinimicrobium sp.]HKJ11832.1 GlsB/YeaQ/YmgE family stress response membrane protein [Ornithinimicrobium sp.]